MKKAVKVFFILMMCLVFSLPLVIPAVNDIIAVQTMNNVRSVPLPEKTEYIEKISTAGKFSGNGNGMQYLGAVLIKSSLSEEELKKHYNTYSENDRTYFVSSQKSPKIKQAENYPLSFKADVEGDDYYIVYSYGSCGNDFPGFLLDFDLRGH